MIALFLGVLNLSINASWMILAVLVLRMLIKKAPKWISCLLWGLVAIRLICPYFLESAFSLLPSVQVIPKTLDTDTPPMIDTGITIFNDAINPILSASFTPQAWHSVTSIQVKLFFFSILWIAGMVFFLIYALITFFILKKKVSASIPLEKGLWVCDEITMPFVLGFFHPTIYLPSSVKGETFDMVLAHEKVHLIRKDHWWKLIGFALLAVHWFNPLCWVSYILLSRDIESACDEKVIIGKDIAYVAAYSQALLDLSISRKMVSVCPLAFGENDVKGRIKNVLSYKKPSLVPIILGVIGCIVVSVCFLTNPQKENSDVLPQKVIINYFMNYDEYNTLAVTDFFNAELIESVELLKIEDGDNRQLAGYSPNYKGYYSDLSLYNVTYEITYKNEYLHQITESSGTKQKLFILVKNEDGWLIDSIGY